MSAPKRSLFKKPSWAATDTSSQKAGDFFRHAESTYREIVAEKEKRRERQNRKQEKAAEEVAEDRLTRQSKRRRISEEDEDVHSGHGSDESQVDKITRPVTRSTPTKKEIYAGAPSPKDLVTPVSPAKTRTPAKAVIIEVGDDSSDDNTMPETPPKPIHPSSQRSRSKAKPVVSDPESEDEDEYTLELKRKARERERLRKEGRQDSAKANPAAIQISLPSSVAGRDQSLSSTHSPVRQSSESSIPPASPKRKDDTIIQILIQTAIPDTKPLIVNRRATQSLKPVKDAWCLRQGYDAAKSSKVILTWRGKRLWNTSTCTYILKKLKEERQTSSNGDMNGDDDEDGNGDPSKGRIEVEAVTEEILEHRARAKEKEALAEEETEENIDVYGGTFDEDRPPPKEPEIVIQLKSPGLETLLLKVRPSTAVKKIMAGFKKMKRLGDEKTCWLIFDGERLEPESTIGEREIENEDVVEVMVR